MSLQDRVGQWADQTFPQSTIGSMLAHLRREVDELGAALSKGAGYEEELADCQMLLFHIAHRVRADIQDATRLKFAVVQTRTWGQPDAEGVVEHIRETQP